MLINRSLQFIRLRAYSKIDNLICFLDLFHQASCELHHSIRQVRACVEQFFEFLLKLTVFRYTFVFSVLIFFIRLNLHQNNK